MDFDNNQNINPQQESNDPNNPLTSPSIFNGLLKLIAKHLLIVLILGIIVFSSGIYLLDLSRKNTKPVSLRKQTFIAVPTPTLTPVSVTLTSMPSEILTPTFVPTPTTNPTLDWNTFTSTYSYSLKYPQDWNAKITAQTDPKILEYVVLNPKTASASALSVTISYGTRTYSEVIALKSQNGETVKNASVSGYKSIESDSKRNPVISIVFPVNNKSITLLAKKEFEETFNKILSTLKF